ncbi:MAG: hypothetical protein JWN33_335 [Candidatus Saccharibacteria bacterium]|nr:hypothetical protein [Candidatus Saccharibacteria bacterium]
MSPLRLLTAQDYLRDLTTHVKAAKKRIYLLALIVSEDSSTEELIEALLAAAKRGVSVTVAGDLFTYGEVSGGFLPLRFYNRNARRTSDMVRRFKTHGASFSWLGRSHTTIFTGRTHSKWSVVDDTVYSFGGVNLYHPGIESVDYMLKVTDNNLADRFAEEHRRLTQADKTEKLYRSHRFFYQNHTVYIDGGIVGDSIIYRRATQLARQAEDILLVSQYCPTGTFGRMLRKKPSRLYFNKPQNATFLNKLVIRYGMLMTKHETLYRHDRYLHGKFIIFTMKDGKKIALSGSHNFAHSGVLLGTREIALETSDPDVIRQLEQFWRDNIA